MQSLQASSCTGCRSCIQQSRAASKPVAAKEPQLKRQRLLQTRAVYTRDTCASFERPQTLQYARCSRAVLLQQRPTTVRRGDRLQMQAGPVDAPPTWTLDQIAGLAFGVLMVVFYFSANAVDVWVAKQQRRGLGLCEECGGVFDPATCAQQKCPLRNKQQ